MLRISVGRNGEDYSTIQEALDSVPYDVEVEIAISEGIYREKLFSDKRSLALKGIGDVVITWSDSARQILDDGRRRGTFRSYTAFFSGSFLRLENLTIENGAGPGAMAGQGIALYLDADTAELEDVRIRGHQDTLFLAPLPDAEREKGGFYGPRHLLPRRRTASSFRGCTIEGGVDFIFGSGDALFIDCDIISCEPGYVAAPSGKKDWFGFAFVSCRFSASGAGSGSVHLMRPWRDEGKAAFISCTFGEHVAPSGFIAWSGREDEADKATFIISDCTFAGPEAIDPSSIVPIEEAERLLDDFPLKALLE